MRFDGDTISVNVCYSDEALAEAKEYFTKRKAYIKPGGGFAFSTDIHTVALVLRAMTGPAQDPVAA